MRVRVLMLFLIMIGVAQAATLNCQQISSVSLEVAQFSSTEIEIQCTASGTVSNIQITPNIDPSSGLTLTSSQTITSTLSDSETGTAKWSVTGDSPNDYTISYSISSDGTNSWTGSSTTSVEVTSPAQLTVSYVSAPSTYNSTVPLNFQINNIGGTAATNIKLQLNSNSKVNYPTSIAAGSSASYSWTSTSGYSAAGTYTTKVYIGDILHDSAATTVNAASSTPENDTTEEEETTATTPTTTTTTTTTSTSGSDTKEILSWLDVMIGDKLVMTVDNSGIAVTKVSALSKVEKEIVTFVVESHKLLPSEIPEPDDVYQYLEIRRIGLKETDLADIKINFKVKKSWLEKNALLPKDIIFMRYNEEWEELGVEIIREDDTYVHFSAETPGFSYFVIAAIRPLLLTSLSPTISELKDIAGQALDDPLIKTKLQEYFEIEIDFPASKTATEKLIDNIKLEKNINKLDNESLIEIVIQNTGSESLTDFMVIEAIPKSIIEDISEIKDPLPRTYDLIIKEDPIIQWRFKEFDTAIVAWKITELKPGVTTKISYKVDKVIEANDHVSTILVKVVKPDAIPTGDVISAAPGSGKKVSNSVYLLLGITIFSLFGVIGYLYKLQPGNMGEIKSKISTGFSKLKKPKFMRATFKENEKELQAEAKKTTLDKEDIAAIKEVVKDVKIVEEPSKEKPKRVSAEKKKELHDFIKIALETGYSEKEIREKLKMHKWDDKTIDNAFKECLKK